MNNVFLGHQTALMGFVGFFSLIIYLMKSKVESDEDMIDTIFFLNMPMKSIYTLIGLLATSISFIILGEALSAMPLISLIK